MQRISRASQIDKLSLIFLSVGRLTPFSEKPYQFLAGELSRCASHMNETSSVLPPEINSVNEVVIAIGSHLPAYRRRTSTTLSFFNLVNREGCSVLLRLDENEKECER
jgi:hypothetical protein